MTNLEKLQSTLREIFEMDKADLDFGIYRIMNQKRKEVNEFIDKTLPKEIKVILSKNISRDTVSIEKELSELEKTLSAAGILKEDSPKYISLKEKLTVATDTNALEQEIFSHLSSFFKRYYKEGDFISMRRYKKDVYAIPYEGEEVKLHWANHDQYYIKTSEHLKNYSFKIGTLPEEGKEDKRQTVHFRLKEASTEQNNNKTQGDTERRFAIYEELPIETEDNHLYINFTYEEYKKSVKQADLTKVAIQTIFENIPSDFADICAPGSAPTEKNRDRTIVEKHLNDFISRNTFDYFIHKDLGGFLNRELDFYIKNEVLYIDDIDIEQPDYFIAQLSKVKALKTVAQKVIAFLTQIEEFQKKLWLKKKFVIRTEYCITLDKIPEEYYDEIVGNKAQLEEWKQLFDVDIKNREELHFEQFLVLDTKFFSDSFKDKLLSEFYDLDKEIDGVLINSENFQALNLLQEKGAAEINTIYVDPPYNTAASEIIYKNNFKHSSWLSLLSDRIILSKNMLEVNGFFNITIDYAEVLNLGQLTDMYFGFENRTGFVSILINPKGRQHERFFTSSIEYMLTYAHNQNKAEFNKVTIDEDKSIQFNELETDGRKYRLDQFARIRTSTLRTEKPNFYYPIYVSPDLKEVTHINKTGYSAVYPIVNDIEYTWKVKKETFIENNKESLYIAMRNESDDLVIYNKFYEQQVFKNIWTDKKYFAEFQGTNLLKDILGDSLFSYPKSIYAVYDTLKIMSSNEGIILDYFAGSGTTGHAAIKLNRDNKNSKRKYFLVEMGIYFDTVTKPRIQKVIYSDNWKNGKPQDKDGISQLVKYQVLESYEDTLNNLLLKENKSRTVFDEESQEEYLLHYMLDMETRDQLFDIDIFKDPFNYKLNVTENNELIPTRVDLVETFNYLIGLYVERMQRVKDIKLVEGKTREGLKTLIIWRNTETVDNDEVQRVFRKLYDSVRSMEFDQIYINGDHHFQNFRVAEDSFKVKLIEDEFFKRMFEKTN